MSSGFLALLERAASKYLGWKIERELCSTVNIATLAGEQVINGELATHGMHVLLTAQADPKQNGPHVVKTGAWERPPDYDATGGARKATTIVVLRGTNAGEWRLTSPTAGDITVDQTATTWSNVGGFATAAAVPNPWSPTNQVISDTATLALSGATGLELQGSDVSITSTATTVEITAGSDVTIAGTNVEITGTLTNNGSVIGAAATDALTAKLAVRARMPAQLTIPATLVTDGGVTAVAGDRILLDSLTTQADRGIYIAAAAASWTRAGDFNATADIADGALVLVVAGTDAGKLYQLDQLGATLGTTSLTFSQVGGGGSYTAGDGLTLTGSDFDVDLTDTTVFDSAATASRAVVRDANADTAVRYLTAERVNGTSNTLRLEGTTEVEINCGVFDLNATGAVTVDGTTVGIDGTGAMSLGTANQTGLTVGHTGAATSVRGSNAYMQANVEAGLIGPNSVLLHSGSGRVNVGVGAYRFDMGAFGGPYTHLVHLFPAAVTPGSAAATTIGTIALPANSAGRAFLWISVRNGSANSKQFKVEFSWNSDASTVALRDWSCVVEGTTQGTIGTADTDIPSPTTSGLNAPITAANASGFRCKVSGFLLVNL